MRVAFVVALSSSLLAPQALPPRESVARPAAKAAIAEAVSPADCVKALRAFVGKRQQELRPPTGYTNEILKKVEDEKAELGVSCVQRFQLSSNPSVLPGLAELLFEVGQPDLAREAIAAALGATLPPAARASALVTGVTLGLREPKSDERNARLETLVAELDRIPEATLEQKWTAHGRLENYYRADDIDAGIIRHGRWMAATAATFTPDQRRQYGHAVIGSQINVAEALAGQGMNDEALALLRETEAGWKDVEDASDIAPVLARYLLVGTAAAPVKGVHWINAAAGTSELAMTGAVTLLEFTAHWCGPCRESYPGINRLREKFGAKGFRVVMATRYWGYFSHDGKTERDLSNEEEFKRDVGYFAGYKLDVPVAIGAGPAGRDPNDTAYKVGGIPQIQLIDKRGRIRLIMVGYDDANEEKLAAFIARLLAE